MIELDRCFVERVILAVKGQLSEHEKNIVINELELLVDVQR
jgi:hypothetical protein